MPAEATRAAAPVPASPRAARPAERPSIQLRPTANVALAATPIARDWLLDAGEPRTEAATLAADDHGTLAVYLWQTTRARYRWEHASDEVVTILDGECFVADEGSETGQPGGQAAERRLATGDVAFFPAGSRSVWRVPRHIRKVSTLVRPLPRPLRRAWRGLRALRRSLRPPRA